MRGLSEIAAAVLLTAVVVAAGSLIVIALTSWFTMLQSLAVREEARYAVSVSQALAVATALINASNYTVVVIVTGPNPVTLLAVYVDGSLASNVTVVGDEGAVTLDGGPVQLAPLRAYRVVFPATSDTHDVKIVYEGGAVEVIARKA